MSDADPRAASEAPDRRRGADPGPSPSTARNLSGRAALLDELRARIEALPPQELAQLIGHTVGVLIGQVANHRPAPSEPLPSLRVIEESDRLVNVKEAALILGMSPDWVYEHWQEFSFARKQGRSVRFSLYGLRKHVSRRTSP